jgi:phosphoribosylformimino-5-aminoimidazole carboxamide ribotide isomerase
MDAVMRLFPAIDLKDGTAVRLVRGEMDKATVFNADPADQARRFEALGFDYLHLVDLNGAFAGRSVNGESVAAIRAAVSLPIQLGGGIRDRAGVERWLGLGITRVILGTIAVRDPDFVREVARAYPGRVAVGIDARGGQVAVEGWAETSTLTALELARRFEDAGVAAIIYTDIDRDGLLAGINWAATLKLARAVSIPVIASGGFSAMADVERLCAPDARILEGAIVGRALYDGRIDAKEAIARLGARPAA